jgi:hypothetical protein
VRREVKLVELQANSLDKTLKTAIVLIEDRKLLKKPVERPEVGAAAEVLSLPIR